MPALTRFLYPLPAARRDWWSQLNWWESRRLAYNVVVGSAGLFTLGVVSVLMWIPPHAIPGFFPILPVVAYGVLANVCYTFGFAIERALAWLWKNDREPAPDAGPVLFRQGVLFSVGLTLLPVGLAVVQYIARVVAYLIGQ
jgi:hypothetical protein